MAVQNSLNITSTGIVSHDGSGVFAGRTVTGTTDFIDAANGTGVAGDPTLSIASNFQQTGMHTWNGSFVEKAVTTVTSDGATIILSIEQSGGGDLTVVFSDGYYAYDTTPADTVTLTAGTDTVPQTNYVYLLQSTKTLTASTVGWPATECARLATVICESAATLQTKGPYKHHQWTDDATETNEQGHITDITFWIRSQNATWIDGVGQTYTITPNGGAADNVILTATSGNILQLHDNAFPAFTGTPDIYVINDNATPYTIVTDLNALLTDSTGASMSGRYFSLVIWGVSNQNTGDCKLICNLPSGSYSNSTQVQQDPDGYANYTIPVGYKGTGFLISEWKLRHQATASGTWTSIEELDLRGLEPSVLAGDGNTIVSEFADTAFRVYDDGDNSKNIAFQASGITTATTRTITMDDADVSLVPNTGTYPAAAGGTQIVTLGTITTGVWNGTTVAVANGGTGATTLTGVLTGNGTGAVTANAVTQYGTVIAGASNAVSSVAPSATVGVPLVSAGAAANPAYGTATVAGGGTGATTLTGVLTGNGTSAVTANAVTQYGVLVGGASNAVSSTAVGTATHVLTSNGAGLAPTFQAAAGGGGGLVFISSATAATSSSLTFTGIDSTYNSYFFVFDAIEPTGNGASYWMRTSTDGGTTYDSGATDYSYITSFVQETQPIARASSASASYMLLANVVSNVAGREMSGHAMLINPSSTDFTVTSYATRAANTSGYDTIYNGFGTRKSAADVDAVEFFYNGTTMASGTISMYGMTTPT
jgi:hypothetical protein